ncbi:MAG: ATP-grasp domain-containing protein [Promethearchaeota archaeon]
MKILFISPNPKSKPTQLIYQAFRENNADVDLRSFKNLLFSSDDFKKLLIGSRKGAVGREVARKGMGNAEAEIGADKDSEGRGAKGFLSIYNSHIVATVSNYSYLEGNKSGDKRVLSRVQSGYYNDYNEMLKRVLIEEVGGIDGVFNRGIGTSKFGKIYYRLGIYGAIEKWGLRLINSRACLELSANKMLGSISLNMKGVPTPEAIITEEYSSAMDAFHILGGDVIVKPLFGARGRGVSRITNEGLAEYFFYNLLRMDEPYYIQKYYNHGNYDIRSLVIGDEVVALYKRESNSWKSNIHGGAKAVLIEGGKAGADNHESSGDNNPNTGLVKTPINELEELALRSAEAVQGDIIGVDIIETDEGPYVIEVNAVPGFLGYMGIFETDNNGESNLRRVVDEGHSLEHNGQMREIEIKKRNSKYRDIPDLIAKYCIKSFKS